MPPSLLAKHHAPPLAGLSAAALPARITSIVRGWQHCKQQRFHFIDYIWICANACKRFPFDVMTTSDCCYVSLASL